jgi:pantoate--beta-alanine ligase
MQAVHRIAELRSALTRLGPVVLVPTMGNLHAGHLALVKRAQSLGLPVAVSIFVNPLQFAPTEDFDAYPRTLPEDCAALQTAGCDLVFAPAVADMYETKQSYFVAPDPDLTGVLEGKSRPGFFTGVCTVVLKLLNLIQPRAAVFGKKDYQQLRVIQQMVAQLNLPVDIIAAETVREANGLAMSSRNGFLTASERAEAPRLHAELLSLAQSVRAGRTDYDRLCHAAVESLAARGWAPDYVDVRSQRNLAEPAAGEPLLVVGAARLGRTRLIDNIEI